MATWGSSVDVLADLDRLSEFSAGCNYTKDIPILSYSSYGRGSVIQERESSSPPPCPGGLGTFDKDDCFSQPTLTFGYGAGRGERILALNKHREKSSLQRQLRMAMGPGFSNELIEDFIRGDSSSEHSGQFEDIKEESAAEDPATEDNTGLHESTTDDSGASLGTPLPLSSSSPSTSISPVFYSAEETLDTKTAVAEVKIQKKSPRRNRNALINSLINNKGKEKDLTTETINETKNRFTSPTKFNRDSIKRSKIEVFNSEPVGAVDDIYIPNLPIKNSNDFYLREEDFPPL